MVETPPVTSEALAQIAQKGGGCLTLGVVIRGQAGWAPSTDGAVGVPLHCREWDPMDFGSLVFLPTHSQAFLLCNSSTDGRGSMKAHVLPLQFSISVRRSLAA